MQCISTLVTFAAACFFGFLARHSPKKDWEFIKGWPAFALFVVSGIMSQTELAQQNLARILPPPASFVCEWVTNTQGLPERKCDWVSEESQVPPPESPLTFLARWIGGTFLSVLLDIPPELIGVALGMAIARRSGGAPPPA
jgi:hypothetical protein